MRLIETGTGQFSLLLHAGTTSVDELIGRLGRAPNGYFWEDVAHFLVDTQDTTLKGRFSYDSEAGMFCAYGEDRAALEALAAMMSAVIADEGRMRLLIEASNGSDPDD